MIASGHCFGCQSSQTIDAQAFNMLAGDPLTTGCGQADFKALTRFFSGWIAGKGRATTGTDLHRGADRR